MVALYEVGIGHTEANDQRVGNVTDKVLTFPTQASFDAWLDMADLTPYAITYSSSDLTVMQSEDGRWVQIDKL